ncbi:TPA: LOW QUALITY PROTEIN: hypothetical protein N0F65_010666 [Lagenidium giganteum]|uniref:Uncharacterized protein n=1 Tax=Lagenidium giganteum TaxID=4803 RepID=A0AAV2Z6Y6_9STRA|nr:TPA: LOW QUALITY PROTEIN: hypothetical protein N0F65_010666 [Lagenidium giganteum]
MRSNDEDSRLLESFPVDVRANAARLISADPCQPRCLRGKASKLAGFLTSLQSMSKEQIPCSVMTVLVTLPHCEAKRASDRESESNDSQARERYKYVLPVVGEVCRESFAVCYGVSTKTIVRMQKRINGDLFSTAAHSGRRKQNASRIDVKSMIAWFCELAETTGEFIPCTSSHSMDRRRQETTTTEDHRLLPSYYTWQLLDEMKVVWAEKDKKKAIDYDNGFPSVTSLRKILQKTCPQIQIRSPRDHECDLCMVKKNELKGLGREAKDTNKPSDVSFTMEIVSEICVRGESHLGREARVAWRNFRRQNCTRILTTYAAATAATRSHPNEHCSCLRKLRSNHVQKADPKNISDTHSKLLPYVPKEYHNDVLYAAPTTEQAAAAAAKRKNRMERKRKCQEAEETKK